MQAQVKYGWLEDRNPRTYANFDDDLDLRYNHFDIDDFTVDNDFIVNDNFIINDNFGAGPFRVSYAERSRARGIPLGCS
jgi:outer membrane protease